MGAKGGPNTVNENLVFGYDTGYGVADNETATRFYPGEPTVNLVTNGDFSNGSTGWNFVGAAASYSEFTTFQGRSVLKANGLTNYNNRGYLYQSINVTSGQTYTVSFSYYLISGQLTYDPDNASNSNSTFTSPTNEWKTHTHTFTAASSTLTINLWGVNANPGYWYITDIQCEQKTHETPFVNGTRSSTQSLIDLKRTTTIDTNTTSFDSTGQPTFDGTDDIIELNRLISTSNYSAEFIFKADVNTSGTEHWLGSQYPGTGRVVFDLSTNNKLRNFINGTSINGATTINTGTWYHAVFTRDLTGAAKIYLNGVQDATGTLSTAAPVNDNFEIGGSTTLTRWLTGDIPIAKVYNQVLSADEIKQNFNAYKNRFNI